MSIDREKLLDRMIELTRDLNNTVDPDAYLLSVLAAASELTESESASLLEYNEDTRDMTFRLVPWIQEESISSARVPLEGSIAGWVYQNNKPLIINDVTKDERFYSKIDKISNHTTYSILGVPLLVHGHPEGVLEVFNKKSSYLEEDVQILVSIASLCSAALQFNKMEMGVRKSNEGSRDLDRLKNEFIAITSHELRTPLGLILGHSTFLKELVSGTEYKEQVEVIIRNASRLKEIIESLTSVDNYETGGALVRSRKVSVARTIEDVTASFAEMARQKRIVLLPEIDSSQGLWVDVDSGKVTIVLSNLIKNAIAFSEEGGRVVIRGEQKPDFVQVSVEDSGIGIPARDLPHVFDRFYQVESHLTRKHGGMGLGLSVAKVMVEMHGGRIWADSVEGAGTKFTFVLPIRKREESEKPQVFLD